MQILPAGTVVAPGVFVGGDGTLVDEAGDPTTPGVVLAPGVVTGEDGLVTGPAGARALTSSPFPFRSLSAPAIHYRRTLAREPGCTFIERQRRPL